MSKITIEKNKVIIEGHANDPETCNTLTNLCDELSKSSKFRTVKYENGYGEFDSVEENEEGKFPPTLGYVYIYSNDGSEQYGMYQAPGTVVLTTEGVTSDAGADYTYSGSKTFAGLSTTKNATIPEYAPGDSISIPDSGTLNLYVVEGNVTPSPPATHKTLINGTVYTVQSGKCMVDGTVYNILKGRTLIGGTGYDITFKPSYDPVFANNTWEQIIAACHNNAVPETWKVADQKPMTIGGSDYLIDIIGKNHDDYSDGSGKAPLTFQLHDCYKLKKAMHNTTTNSKGWSGCDMRETDLPIILKQMPTEVQSGIREVNKLTSENYTIVTTADKLFLLSEIEIFGSDENSGKGEGTQYDYYKVGNSKVKNYIDGSAIEWWERSPYNGNKRFYCCVNYKGASISRSANAVSGVPFAFCF